MSSFEGLVARQIAASETKRRLENTARQAGRGEIHKVHYGPYLLVSRDKGSGGHSVAHIVGERLGWQVFDREIVNQIAERAQVRRELIESLDERGRTVVEDVLMPALQRSDIGQLGFFLHLKQVVLALGQQGNVVIVGRGARHILPARFGLRVRLVAPLEIRAQRIAEEQRLPLDAAREQVQKSDRERAAFIHHHFHAEASDPLCHDLIFNTAQWSSEQVAATILAALHQKLGVEVP